MFSRWFALSDFCIIKMMADIWFTSDFHLGHSNIIRFCKRPFANAHEMNEAIAERMNSCVKPDDTLYFLGDFLSWQPQVRGGVSRTACLQDHPFHRGEPRQDARGNFSTSSHRGACLPRSPSANRASCFATMPCGYGRIMLAAPGICTDIRTAICRTIRWRFLWMLAWIRMISASGTSTKFRQS